MRLRESFNTFDLFYWTCPPDLGKVKPHQAKNYKLDGYEKGVFDLTIIAVKQGITRVYLVEFKYGNNGYTPEQKEIALRASKTSVKALKIRSLDEFKAFVKGEVLLA